MSVSPVMFSSRSDVWETPQDIFDALDSEFGFELDVAALPENAKCERFFTPEDDGLAQPWVGVCWMNPPYGKEIGRWLKKAYEESQQEATVVCLIPARTGTGWWHDYCMLGEVRLLRRRLRFGDAHSSAPFDSAIVVFRPNSKPRTVTVGTKTCNECGVRFIRPTRSNSLYHNNACRQRAYRARKKSA